MISRDLAQDLYELEVLENAKREKNFYSFFQKAWTIINPETPLLINWHQELIAEYMTAVQLRQIKRLIVNIPPRYIKSSLITITYPCWAWAKNPTERFMHSSYNYTLSMKHGDDRRAILRSKWYSSAWNKFRLVKDAAEKITNNKRGHMIATSMQGAATGDGGNNIFIDDPHDALKANSDVMRKKDNESFDKKFITRLDDKENGVIVIVMQRLHEDDLTGHVMAKEGEQEYTHLVIPAEAEHKTTYSFPISCRTKVREEGDILHEAREDAKALALQRRNQGSYNYEGQYQQNPSPREGGIIKRNYWQYYNKLPLRTDGLLDFEQIVDFWDCSFKDLKTSDFVAGGVWGVKGADRWLLHVTYERLGFLATIKAMLDHRKRFMRPKKNPDDEKEVQQSYISKTIIEDKANGTAIIEVMKSKVSGIIAFNPGTDSKFERVCVIEPQLEAKNFYIPTKDCATFDVEMYVDNLAKFPNAKKDDLVDMTSMMGIYLKKSLVSFEVF